MRDLFVLAADNNIKSLIAAALARPQALGIRAIDFEIGTHSGRDPGMRTSGVHVLRTAKTRFAHALLVFDYEGCGEAEASADTLEATLDRHLANDWGLRGKAIVIVPESDTWVWGTDAAMAQVLNWPGPLGIRSWLAGAGFPIGVDGKPARPKEAMERLAAQLSLPRSSAIYGRLAARVSLERCTDPAFGRLRTTVRRWFPPG